MGINVYKEPIPCRLEGWAYGYLNGWAMPGVCSTDVWLIKSICGQVSIRVAARVATSRVDGTDSLPVFYYD